MLLAAVMTNLHVCVNYIVLNWAIPEINAPQEKYIILLSNEIRIHMVEFCPKYTKNTANSRFLCQKQS